MPIPVPHACETRELARLQLPGAFDDQIACALQAGITAVVVCRYSAAGAVSPPEWHGEIWVAALYVAMIQLGGVGSIVP